MAKEQLICTPFIHRTTVYSTYGLSDLWNIFIKWSYQLRSWTIFSGNMAAIIVICTVLIYAVVFAQCQVYVFENIEAHEQRISVLESSTANATTCCSTLKKENGLLKNQNQQLMTMMQNLSLQVLLLQQKVDSLTAVPSTPLAPPTPPPPMTTIPTQQTTTPSTTTTGSLFISSLQFFNT